MRQQRRSNRRRGSGGGRGFAGRALLARFLPLLDALQLLVDAHSQKLQNQIGNAQAALNFFDGFRLAP